MYKCMDKYFECSPQTISLFENSLKCNIHQMVLKKNKRSCNEKIILISNKSPVAPRVWNYPFLSLGLSNYGNVLFKAQPNSKNLPQLWFHVPHIDNSDLAGTPQSTSLSQVRIVLHITALSPIGGRFHHVPKLSLTDTGHPFSQETSTISRFLTERWRKLLRIQRVSRSRRTQDVKTSAKPRINITARPPSNQTFQSASNSFRRTIKPSTEHTVPAPTTKTTSRP